jgi:hypothetical protein
VKLFVKITLVFVVLLNAFSCKKNKLTDDPSAIVAFSQDSVLFDTVFTTIGSTTRHIRVINNNSQRVKISNINLKSGGTSGFKLNVDGLSGLSFDDVEIAAHDSMYIFIQVNVNPTNQNSPLVIRDEIDFTVNGNLQKVHLEAWGQDAYYHRPTDAIKFKDGTYLPYSYLNNDTLPQNAVWNNDKPHVIYGYLVVYNQQKLTINAGARIYLNYKAGLWVYTGGELKVLGQKGNEVIFQGVRREEDWKDEPGQWDRIWINEGSVNNEINYAIIKNGYIGVQAELLGTNFSAPRRLKITNTKIQNMSLWGLYGLAYNIYGANNIISNCQEHSVNLVLGGKYTFIHCTFANFWTKDKAREKELLFINNYTSTQVLPLDSAYFGNCIIDGSLGNEIKLDLQNDATFPPKYTFSNCWLKTDINTGDATKWINVRTGGGLLFVDKENYDWHTKPEETQVKNFVHAQATADASKHTSDLDGGTRNTMSVTAGAYQIN